MQPRLLFTDGDGTLSEVANPFLAIAEVLGCGQAVRQLIRAYLGRELSYAELVERENTLFLEYGRGYAERLKLRALGPDEFDRLFGALGDRGPAKGIRRALDRLRHRGIEVVVISSGWDFIVERLAECLEISEWYTNKLRFVEGEFAGTEIAVSGEKIETFESVLQFRSVRHDQVAYWGDNAFDFPVMQHLSERGGRIFALRTAVDMSERLFPPGTEVFDSAKELSMSLTKRG